MIAYDEDCGGERGVEGRGGTTEETGLIELNLAFGEGVWGGTRLGFDRSG